MRKIVLAVAAALPFLSGYASAATIPISVNENRSGQLDFWTHTVTFNLPSNAVNTVLSISNFFADDRSIMTLNGTTVASTGIFGPGLGSFVAIPGGPNLPFVFQYNNSGPFSPINTGFTIGTNTLTFVVNDTWLGINGDLGSRVNFGFGPTSLSFEGVVSYDVAAGVPEPSTWAMMLIGFAGLAFASRRREARPA